MALKPRAMLPVTIASLSFVFQTIADVFCYLLRLSNLISVCVSDKCLRFHLLAKTGFMKKPKRVIQELVWIFLLPSALHELFSAQQSIFRTHLEYSWIN